MIILFLTKGWQLRDMSQWADLQISVFINRWLFPDFSIPDLHLTAQLFHVVCQPFSIQLASCFTPEALFFVRKNPPTKDHKNIYFHPNYFHRRI